MTGHSVPSRIGRKVTVSTVGERVEAYIPPPLPPRPVIQMESLYRPLEIANRAVGRLNGVVSTLPDPRLFLSMFCRKEALLSSQIEGTMSSLSDLLLFENGHKPSGPSEDAQEVANYIAAMEHGLSRLHGGFPVSLRLIRDIHRILLAGHRGASKQPGEFRRSQNWIGGTRPGNAAYVPAPPEHVPNLMSDLETYFHTHGQMLPELVVSGLIHAQFETIHPFFDGNGRLGRLLITLLLCSNGILDEPILYLSLYFKTHRERYYELLDRVHSRGDWEAWLVFFLESIAETSTQAADAANEILGQFLEDRRKIENIGRAAGSALRVHHQLQWTPLSSIANLAQQLKMSDPAVNRSLDHLVEIGVVREITGKRRRRLYAYTNYLDILRRGTEPIRQ